MEKHSVKTDREWWIKLVYCIERRKEVRFAVRVQQLSSANPVRKPDEKSVRRGHQGIAHWKYHPNSERKTKLPDKRGRHQ